MERPGENIILFDVQVPGMSVLLCDFVCLFKIYRGDTGKLAGNTSGKKQNRNKSYLHPTILPNKHAFIIPPDDVGSGMSLDATRQHDVVPDGVHVHLIRHHDARF